MSEDLLKAAIEITKAQAAVRDIPPEEVRQYLQTIHSTLVELAKFPQPESAPGPEGTNQPIGSSLNESNAMLGKQSIKEKYIECLICGKQLKLLTPRHLAKHGLTVEEYRERFDIPKKTTLASKAVSKDRRKKMAEKRLWELKRPKENGVENTADNGGKKTVGRPKKSMTVETPES